MQYLLNEEEYQNYMALKSRADVSESDRNILDKKVTFALQNFLLTVVPIIRDSHYIHGAEMTIRAVQRLRTETGLDLNVKLVSR